MHHFKLPTAFTLVSELKNVLHQFTTLLIHTPTRRALGRAHYLRQWSLSDSSVNVFVVLDLDLWPWASTAYSAIPCLGKIWIQI